MHVLAAGMERPHFTRARENGSRVFLSAIDDYGVLDCRDLLAKRNPEIAGVSRLKCLCLEGGPNAAH
jgi:hypothetical protein